MPIAVSKLLFLNPREKEALIARMARDGVALLEDMEEGEISSDSVEEISEEGFRQDASSSGVWIGDRVRFPVLGRHYATNLYNFAWAQAVQNKPLGSFGFKEFMPAAAARGPAKEEGCDVVDGGEESGSHDRVEKEDGELEEGELGSFDVEMVGEVVCDAMKEDEGGEEVALEEENLELEKAEGKKELVKAEERNEMEDAGDLDERVTSIFEDLDAITVENAEKSFVGACSRLRKTLDSLHLMASESRIPVLDTLVQQAFMGVKTVHSVFLERKEQNEDALSRLLSHIKNQVSALFTPEQMQEVNLIMQSVVSEDVSKEKERKPCLEPISANSIGGTDARDIPVSSKLPKLEPLFISRSRIDYSPLLDPRAKHDEGSLPSPTRDNAPPLPALKSYVAGAEAVTSLSTTCKQEETEVARLHPYLTNALKAVSSYQQKHCRTSFIPNDRLPSPTPSEECNDDDGDSHGEVSSSIIVSNVRAVNSSISLQSIGSSSSTACTGGSSGQKLLPEKMVGQMSFGQKTVAKVSAKSRDPRLRFANPQGVNALDHNKQSLALDNVVPKNGGAIMNSRKHKIADESALDNHTLKRQRNGILNRDLPVSSGKGGWLEDTGMVAAQPNVRSQSMEVMGVENIKLENGDTGFNRRQDINLKGTNVRNEQVLAMSSTPVVSLPSFLKDIAVNPTMLMDLIKKQQRSVAQIQQKALSLSEDAINPDSTNRLLGTVASVNSMPLGISEPEQKSTQKPQMPVQTASMNSQNDGGRIRMKPRDPRRILHTNVVQKSEKLGYVQLNTNGALSSNIQGSKDSFIVQEQGDQLKTVAFPSQSISLPDIAQQFTNKLKNLANIMSTSQSTNNPPAAIQKSFQSMPTKTDNMDLRPVATESNNQQILSVVAHEESSTGASQLSNQWGDVDHLLDGYDDQQKASIQIERARRIEDQNKMFAARKLSLVLDLDHTLLNSAKFVEVDQVHDEVLRKKEEQDREKPQRHLFRFQHMGMWTKLRPGIWNFLEKASKLYELHLYTMGNKLYASEMAKVLDPTGSLFAGRVLSKGDESDPLDGDDRLPKSKDLDGVLGMESAVVIIDDSVRVWPHHRLNLIVVERYTYFPCSRRQFGLPGPSLLEIDHDERPEDGTLASSLAVIERIHRNFFSHSSLNDIDVRNILASEQRKILSGCRIVFSRIFPVGEANPHLHPLWQTAEQFGAVCTNQIDDQVTHVVANSLGTDKVNRALSRGRFVVYPGWVEASALLYRRASEHDFAVKI